MRSPPPSAVISAMTSSSNRLRRSPADSGAGDCGPGLFAPSFMVEV